MPCNSSQTLLDDTDDTEDGGWTTSLQEVKNEPTESLIVITKRSVYQHQLKMPKLEKYRVTQDEIRDWLSYHIQWGDTMNETALLKAQPTLNQIMNAFDVQLESSVVSTDDGWYNDNFIFHETNQHKAIWQIIHKSRINILRKRTSCYFCGIAFSKTPKNYYLMSLTRQCKVAGSLLFMK